MLTEPQETLARGVLQKLDALDAPGSSIVAPLEEVYENLVDAADEMVLSLPRKLLFDLVKDFAGEANAELSPNGANLAVPLPADFLRLIGIRIHGWSRALYHHDLVEDVGPQYVRKGQGETSDADDPKAFLVFFDNAFSPAYVGPQAIDCYPGTEDAEKLTITATGAAASGADAGVPVEAIEMFLKSAMVLTFSGGGVLTLSADALKGATLVGGSLTADVASDETAEVDRYLEVLLYAARTAPEALPRLLETPLKYLAAHYLFTAIDPSISELARRRYDALISPRMGRDKVSALRRGTYF